MAFVSQFTGYLFLFLFGIVMLAVTYFFAGLKRNNTKEGFLLAGRKINWLFGGASIAASWIWAPALFVSVQLAYQKGLAGVFWFTFPNVVALVVFALLAPSIRKRMPEGYTLPQYIKYRLQSEKVHKIYLIPYFFYQMMAVTVQIFAGGSLIYLLTGIPLVVVMPILLFISLFYTYISGLRASVITDFAQMGIIIVIGIIILPLTWSAAGGFPAVAAGLSGLAGSKNIFDPGIAFSLGIVTSIGLIAGAISDQQYWQRAFAIKKSHLVKAFVFGALLFGIVPIALSTMGFIGANQDLGISLPEGVDVSMIGVQVVASLLPGWAVLLFVIMLLAGLSSTLDSGLSAASSLWVTDVVNSKTNIGAIKSSRIAMLGISILGLAIALAVIFIPQFGLFHLWWIFNAIAACVMVSTILSLYWSRLSANGVLWGVLVAFIVGLPLFIYGNFINNEIIIVMASLCIVLISTIFCLVVPKRS